MRNKTNNIKNAIKTHRKNKHHIKTIGNDQKKTKEIEIFLKID
jgi:hypothetical protein